MPSQAWIPQVTSWSGMTSEMGRSESARPQIVGGPSQGFMRDTRRGLRQDRGNAPLRKKYVVKATHPFFINERRRLNVSPKDHTVAIASPRVLILDDDADL